MTGLSRSGADHPAAKSDRRYTLERLLAMAATQTVLKSTILEIYAIAEAMGIEKAGPAKIVELIPPTDTATTKAYLFDNSLVATFECAPTNAREGFTIFGAALGPEEKIGEFDYIDSDPIYINEYLGFQGCSEAPYCQGRENQICFVQARAPGCYINKEWLEWLQRQPASVVGYDILCRP